jgi:hypothetical protein
MNETILPLDHHVAGMISDDELNLALVRAGGRAFVRAFVRSWVCVLACVRACVHACVRACVHGGEDGGCACPRSALPRPSGNKLVSLGTVRRCSTSTAA